MEKTRLALVKVLVGAIVAITPAVLTYCKASDETDQSAREADAGYKALAQSVKQLQAVVEAQGETLKLLARERYGSMRMGSGSAAEAKLPTDDHFDPHFPELPASNEAALQRQEQQAARF